MKIKRKHLRKNLEIFSKLSNDFNECLLMKSADEKKVKLERKKFQFKTLLTQSHSRRLSFSINFPKAEEKVRREGKKFSKETITEQITLSSAKLKQS